MDIIQAMSSLEQKSKKRLAILISAAIALAAIYVYLPVKDYPFLNFDDNIYIYENKIVQKGLTWDGIVWAFSPIHDDLKSSIQVVTYWHPLTWISHMLDCQLFGLNAGAHHLVNLAIHTACAVLLFFAFFRMTGSIPKSGLIAALFALHPVNIETVAWLAERKNLLSALLALAALHVYIGYVSAPSLKRYLSMLIVFIAGLCAKPMIVTLPFIFLLLDWWPLNRLTGYSWLRLSPRAVGRKNTIPPVSISKAILEKIPMLFFSVVTIYLASFSLSGKSQIIPMGERSLGLRIKHALVSYFSYLEKIFFPRDLAIYYPYPDSVPFLYAAIAGLVLIAITALLVFYARKHPSMLVGWLWFCGALVPVSGIIQGGLWPAIANRFLYLPAIGIFIMTVWGGWELIDKINKKSARISAGVLFSTCLILPLSMATRFQLQFFHDDVVLFKRTADVTEKNFIAYTCLAQNLLNNGKNKEAILLLQKAVKLQPDFGHAWEILGSAYWKEKKYHAAINAFKKALWTNESPKVYSMLGRVLADTGNDIEAEKQFRKAVQIGGGCVELNDYAAFLIAKKRFREAIPYLRRSLSFDPTFITAYINLGQVYLNTKQPGKAIIWLEKGLKLDPDNPKLNRLIADAYFLAAKYSQAEQYYEKLLPGQPEDKILLYNTAVTLFRQNKLKRSLRLAKKALAIDPGYKNAKALINTIKNQPTSMQE